MKKIIISVVFVLAFGAYILYTQQENTAASQATTVAATTALATSSAVTTTSTIQTVAPTQTTPTKTTTTPTGEYKDGTYTGSVADAFYGNLQVQAVISGGKITNVVFLQYPKDQRTSVSINEGAMPTLTSEAIAAQSATVDGVSGASQSSQAFSESLASALAQAKA